MTCPKGYYEKDGRCVKSITIKRKGIYGKGFLSEPQSEQYSKIRKEESREGSTTVERQMGALNAFQHGHGSAHNDLEYAKKIGREKRLSRGSEHGCPEGYEWVSPHKRNGHEIRGHCRKVR
jgi:hypothetical protein